MKHFEFIASSAPDLLTALQLVKQGIADNFHDQEGLVLHQLVIYPEVRLTEGLKTPQLVCHVVGVLRNDSVDLVYSKPAAEPAADVFGPMAPVVGQPDIDF
jgi:hypothetical protein